MDFHQIQQRCVFPATLHATPAHNQIQIYAQHVNLLLLTFTSTKIAYLNVLQISFQTFQTNVSNAKLLVYHVPLKLFVNPVLEERYFLMTNVFQIVQLPTQP